MMQIVDSGTSHKHADFLKDKSDDSTIAACDTYRVMAERQTGRPIKRIRTDQAFMSGKWKDSKKVSDLTCKKNLLLYHDKRFQVDTYFPMIPLNHEQLKAASTM
jgi:signal recognition particle GTPase